MTTVVALGARGWPPTLWKALAGSPYIETPDGHEKRISWFEATEVEAVPGEELGFHYYSQGWSRGSRARARVPSDERTLVYRATAIPFLDGFVDLVDVPPGGPKPSAGARPVARLGPSVVVWLLAGLMMDLIIGLTSSALVTSVVVAVHAASVAALALAVRWRRKAARP